MSTVRSSTIDPDPGVPLKTGMLEDVRMRSVGLFAGIGGFELGLQRAGIGTELLCEYWDPAAAVLKKRFDAEIVGDIRDLEVASAGRCCHRRISRAPTSARSVAPPGSTEPNPASCARPFGSSSTLRRMGRA